MRVDTVFLDAGGVLVYPNWERVAETLARHGVAADPRRLESVEPSVRHELDTARGVQTSTDRSRGEAYFNRVFSRAGIALGPALEPARAELAAYHAEHNLWEIVPGDVVPALEDLGRGGRRLAVVSNSNGTVRAKLERLGLARFFETIVDSQEEGVEKPDPRIFAVALERMDARPEATVHVGDLYHVDVIGARAAGLRAVLVDPRNLYLDHDCARVPSLTALLDAVASDTI
jgi:HAD superfamily hydrolase (TIGR01509 family)